MFSEVSQTKNKYHKFISYHLYVESKRIKTNEYNKTETDSLECKLVYTSGTGKREGQRWGRGLRDTNYYV